MSSQLSGAQKRYIGKSGDVMPYIGDATGQHNNPNDIPVGVQVIQPRHKQLLWAGEQG